jgi:hypothetical protein
VQKQVVSCLGMQLAAAEELSALVPPSLPDPVLAPPDDPVPEAASSPQAVSAKLATVTQANLRISIP